MKYFHFKNRLKKSLSYFFVFDTCLLDNFRQNMKNRSKWLKNTAKNMIFCYKRWRLVLNYRYVNRIHFSIVCDLSQFIVSHFRTDGCQRGNDWNVITNYCYYFRWSFSSVLPLSFGSDNFWSSIQICFTHITTGWHKIRLVILYTSKLSYQHLVITAHMSMTFLNHYVYPPCTCPALSRPLAQ